MQIPTMINVFYSEQQNTWHIVSEIRKSGLGVDIIAYCDFSGDNIVTQLPINTVVGKLKVCEDCLHEISELS